jgi:hypothetical protein
MFIFQIFINGAHQQRMVSVLVVLCIPPFEKLFSTSINPEISHMDRVHEPWGNVIEPHLLKYYHYNNI